jgi:hypothetical protein
MYDLMLALRKTLNQSAIDDLRGAIGKLPKQGLWHVFSDYCFGDQPGKNDVATFTFAIDGADLKMMHLKIPLLAAKDIKNTRSPNPEFLHLIGSPNVFHYSVVIEKQTKRLREYITTEQLQFFLAELINVATEIGDDKPEARQHLSLVKKRLQLFMRSASRKSYSQSLARQIVIVASIAPVMFAYLYEVAQPAAISWMSDRDSIVTSHNGVVYDIAHLMYLYHQSQELLRPHSSPLPAFLFPRHDEGMMTLMDPFIRIPDYLAGAVSDFDFDTGSFSLPKFRIIAETNLLTASNHAVVNVNLKDGHLLTQRRTLVRR